MKDRKYLITAIVTILLTIAGAFFGIKYTQDDVNKITDGVETVVNIVEDNKSTTEIPELTETDEETLEYQETESEAFELQGEIAYNGSGEIPTIEVGQYTGLTYYSQIDSRWRYKPYTSVGNNSQTMGSSACGPTCAAMIVSSIKGTILPTEMADLYVKYGFRSANNGTYWSAFRWTADVFNIGYTETYKIQEALQLLESKNMLIVACGNGLFTTGGHFIVVYDYDKTNNMLKIYDPYLYSGKFNTSTRRGKVTVDGNTVYCSVDNFRQYANYSIFFAFKNDRTDVKENPTTVDTITSANNTFESYRVKVTAKSGLNARTGAGTSYIRKTGYRYGTTLTIVAESNGWGKTSAGYWVCLQYTSKISNTRNTVGQVKTFKSATIIYSNSNLTGTRYDYLKNTTVTVLQNLGNVDKVRVRKTGRVGYVSKNAYK